MFKFSAYPAATFWDKFKVTIPRSNDPVVQEPQRETPAIMDSQRKDQMVALAAIDFRFV